MPSQWFAASAITRVVAPSGSGELGKVELNENLIFDNRIEELAGRIRFTVPLPLILPLSRVQSRRGSGKESGLESEAQVDLGILAACFHQPLSSAEIAAALGHKQLSGNLRRAIPRLRAAGLVEYTLPDRPTSRLQKYRLTQKGRTTLSSNQKSKIKIHKS